MKKIFLIVALLPAALFGSFEYKGYIVDRMRIFTYSDFGVTESSVRAYTVFPNSLGDLSSALSSTTFGMCLDTRSQTTERFVAPAVNSSRLVVPDVTVTRLNITNSVYCLSSTNSTKFAISPLYFDEVSSVYYIASSLYLKGYRGSGLVNDFFHNDNYHCINVNFPTLVADVLSSTNTVYRQILLTSLSSISSGVSDINSSLATIVNILGSGSSGSSFLEPWSFEKITNFCASVDHGVTQGNFTINTDEILRLCNRSSWAEDQEGQYLYDSYLDSVSRALPLYQAISGLTEISANLSNGDSSIFNELGRQLNKSVSSVISGSSGFGGLIPEVKKLNPTNWVGDVKSTLSNNTQKIKDDLAAWHDFGSNSLKQVNLNLSGIAANTSGSAIRSALDGINVSIQNSGDNVVSVDLNGPVEISAEQFTTLDTGLSGLKSIVDEWYQKWYQFYNFGSSFYHWDSVVDRLDTFHVQNNSNFHAVVNAVDAIANISNFLHDTDKKLADNFPNLTNGNLKVSLSASFGSLLHEDYSNFVENSFYDILTNLQDQDPLLYESLQNLGLSDDSYSGRWWNLSASALSQISISVHSNMLMFSSLMSDIASVDSFANDSLGMSPLSAAREIFDSMPSKTQIEDWISQCTNAASEVSVVGSDLVSSLDAVSNSYVSIFKPFNGSFDSPGSSVTFFKAANGDYVTIPVGDQSSAWLILRLGISFALVAVNILLLPKYILMLFTLFIKAYRIAIKFFPDDL